MEFSPPISPMVVYALILMLLSGKRISAHLFSPGKGGGEIVHPIFSFNRKLTTDNRQLITGFQKLKADS
ncbi:MAG: hypothetical protein ABFD51_07030 [Anaerolineaceae bacterium]